MSEEKRAGELMVGMRLPPANVQAEQALLGALLANNKAFDRVAEFLQPHHFIDPIHARIFEAIARRVNAGQVADPVVLRTEFENTGILAEVGGTPYLAQLLSAMVGIINAGDYGRAIQDAWMKRELIDACEVAVNMAFGSAPGTSAEDAIESLDAALSRIAEGAGEVKPLVSAHAAVHEALVLAQAAAKRESPLAGITTGYAALDRMTNGLMPGQMYLLGARPAMGKTGLGLGIAARAASNKLKTLFWSGEMSASQLGTRLAAAHAGLEVFSVFRGRGWELTTGRKGAPRDLSLDEWGTLVTAEKDAFGLPLHFDDRPGITVAALRARARKLKRAGGLDLVVIDYVALLKASPQAEKNGLYARTTELSRDLQMLAAELGVPVLALAQLSRANESRENKMPQLSDLRDSGALEQDAYCVMFLHRPHYYLMQAGEPQQNPKEKAEDFSDRQNLWHRQCANTRDLALMSIAKNRNGPTGICRGRFDAETIWFRDEAEADNSTAWGRDLRGE